MDVSFVVVWDAQMGEEYFLSLTQDQINMLKWLKEHDFLDRDIDYEIPEIEEV